MLRHYGVFDGTHCSADVSGSCRTWAQKLYAGFLLTPLHRFQTHHFQWFLVIPQLCRSEQFRRCFPQYARTYMPGCQRCHLRPNAPVQGLAWYVACCCVLSDGTWSLMSCRPITYGSFSSPSNGVASPTSESRFFDSSPLRVKVTSSSWLRMGRRCPTAPWLESPLSASRVEMMDFTRIHLISHTYRVQEPYTVHATKVPRVSYIGDNFASMSSVLNKWLFRKMSNSRSCDEFSERLQDSPLHTEGS